MRPKNHNPKKKPGRPSAPPASRRDYRVQVYFNSDEHSRLMYLHRTTGEPLSHIIHRLAVSGSITLPITQEEAALLRKLSGMANNLNQLAHQANAAGYARAAARDETLAQDISSILIKLAHK